MTYKSFNKIYNSSITYGHNMDKLSVYMLTVHWPVI